MVIEGLITCAVTSTPEGGPHVAALGPVVNPELTDWTVRPYQSSRIFGLLQARGRCVFHVMDDPLPVVQLVLGQSTELTFRQLESDCWIIEQACQWYQLQIDSWNVEHLRSEARARPIAHGQLRPFWGWNRAKHALLEAAILISRASLLPREELHQQVRALGVPVEKTAGPREWMAWELVLQWLSLREH